MKKNNIIALLLNTIYRLLFTGTCFSQVSSWMRTNGVYYDDRGYYAFQKKIIACLPLLIINCILIIQGTRECYSQWQPDVRLSSNQGLTSYNNAWCVASDANFVHVVWYGYYSGSYEIFYKRSTDGGSSWETDTRLTYDSNPSDNPSIAVSGSLVNTVWEDHIIGVTSRIFYKGSTNNGTTWGSDVRLTNAGLYPSITRVGQDVHVVWQYYFEIYYKRSTDGGSSWGTDTNLSNDPALSISASISASGQNVHVVWVENRDGPYGNTEIYYKHSFDAGANWGTDMRLTIDSAISEHPCVATSGSIVHVVWQDHRDGNDEIYYKRSTNGGVSWGSDIRLTNNSLESEYPSISASGSNVHVVWSDPRDGNLEIYYKRSTDDGTNWGIDARLTNNAAISYGPSISVSGQALHVVWNDDRDTIYHIYYKRDPTGNAIGMEIISLEVPKEFKLHQNYPNPFNPVTKIRFEVPATINQSGNREADGLVSLRVFDILGNEGSTLVNAPLKPGTYEVEWDGTNYPSGVYYFRLTSDGFIQTKKMVLLK